MKNHVKRMKSQIKDWKNILQITCLTKDYHPEHIGDPQNSIVKEDTTSLENGQEVWTDISVHRINS